MQKFTAIIPVGNEIQNIEAVLDSVSFADEVLVVDSYSTDGTYEKAVALGATIIRRKFDYHAAQKNWAIPQAKHKWILLVDADERVTPELKYEITHTLSEPKKEFVAYWIRRQNYFMGKRVNFSGWRNDKVIRLFKRDFCRYEDLQIHEEIIAKGPVGILENKLLHNTYKSIDHYIQKKNVYAEKQARDYDKKTGKLNLYHFFLKPFWGFFKHYIVQSGFRDGVVGLTISFIQGYFVFMRYVKIWLLRRGLK